MYDNYHYPAGADNEQAPWYETDVPEKAFEVTCSQTLSRTASILTNNYIPGESGVDYETDDEGHPCAVPWQDPDDTSDTNWAEEWRENNHYTPIQLLGLFKQLLEENLQNGLVFKNLSYTIRLIKECDGWTEDETEIIEE